MCSLTYDKTGGESTNNLRESASFFLPDPVTGSRIVNQATRLLKGTLRGAILLALLSPAASAAPSPDQAHPELISVIPNRPTDLTLFASEYLFVVVQRK